MNIINKSNKKSYIILFFIITIIYLFLMKSIKYSINLADIEYSIKFSYLYYQLMRSNIFIIFIIPIFLYIHKNIYNYFYTYKIIIKYRNIKDWWNILLKKSIITSINYILIINLITISLSIYRFGAPKLLQFKIFVYFLLSILIQVSFFIILCIILNIFMFIIKKFYLWFCLLISILLILDNLFSTLKIFDLNIKNILFFTFQDNFINYSNKIFLFGFLLFTIILLYEIGVKVINKFSIYWRN